MIQGDSPTLILVITPANDTTRPTISELFEGYEDEYESIQIDWGTPVG